MIPKDQWVYIIITVLGAWINLRVAVAIIGTKVDRAIDDIDGIAEFVGTPRALARKQKKEGQNEKLVSTLSK